MTLDKVFVTSQGTPLLRGHTWSLTGFFEATGDSNDDKGGMGKERLGIRVSIWVGSKAVRLLGRKWNLGQD